MLTAEEETPAPPSPNEHLVKKLWDEICETRGRALGTRDVEIFKAICDASPEPLLKEDVEVYVIHAILKNDSTRLTNILRLGVVSVKDPPSRKAFEKTMDLFPTYSPQYVCYRDEKETDILGKPLEYLQIAASCGFHECVHVLLEAGANPLAQTPPLKLTALCFAVNACSLKCVEHLWVAGANVDHRDKYGFTVLHKVCMIKEERYTECLKLLVKIGADVNIRAYSNRHMMYPIHAATMYDNAEALRVLLKAGANVNALDVCEKTALMIAACHEKSPCFAPLLEANSDVLLFDENKNTALHLAVRYRATSNVRALLDAGSDPNTVNADGSTPVYSASKHDSPECMKLLLLAGADPKCPQQGVKKLPPLEGQFQRLSRARYVHIMHLMASGSTIAEDALYC